MSTQLVSSANNVSLNRFWGGTEGGTMVQVTVKLNEQRKKVSQHQFGFQFVELTREQAAELANDLLAFANGNEVEDH